MSVIGPAIRSCIGSCIGSVFGDDGARAYLKSFLTDMAPWTLTRANSPAGQSGENFGQLIWEAEADEPVLVGTRRAENLDDAPTDLTGWNKYTADGATITDNPDNSVTLASADSSSRAFINKTYTLGVGEYRITLDVKGATIARNRSVIVSGGGTATWQNTDALLTDDNDKRVSSTLTVTVAGTVTLRAGPGAAGTSADGCTITGVLLETAAGNAPSELVTGIQHFATTNANTVDANGVVVERQGQRLHPSYTGTIYGDSFANNTNDIGQHVSIKMPYTCRKMAVAGDNLSEIKAVFDSDFPHAGDNFVMLQGGINDLVWANSDPNAAMRANMAAMIAAAEAANMMVVVYGAAPWKTGTNVTWTEARQAYTDSYNAWLASTYPHYYSDIYAELEDPAVADAILPAYDSGDALHPNTTGYIAADVATTRLFPQIPMQGVLTEGERKNYVRDSEDIAQWSLAATLTPTNDGTRLRGIPAPRLYDDGTAASAAAITTLGAFTVSEPLALSFLVQGDTSTEFKIGVRNTSDGEWLTYSASIDGPGAIGEVTGTIANISELSATEPTKVTLLFDYIASGSDVLKAYFYPTGTAAVEGALYATAMQFEDGAFTSGYIPSLAGVATTRPATQMSATIAELGLPDDLINSISGQIKVRPRFDSSESRGAYTTILQLFGDASNSIQLLWDDTDDRIFLDKISGGSTSQAAYADSAIQFSRDDLLNIRWSASPDGLWLKVNDLAPVLLATGTAPDDLAAALTAVYLGQSSTGGTTHAFQVVESLKIWPEAKSAAFLEALT